MLDIFARITDNVPSVGAPHLEPRLLGLMSPRALVGFVAPDKP